VGVERLEAEAIYDQGREAVVAVLLRMDEQIGRLEARVARQDERISQLERRLNRSSRNSSAPPSSDPPAGAPKRGEGPSGRGHGGQPGHEGHGRDLLPACAVDEVVEHWPVRCGCGHVFCEQEHDPVGEPVLHQIEELPELTVRVIEHRAQRLCCPSCGNTPCARLPREVSLSCFGPRLQAALVALSVRNRVSRRDVVELGEELFGARLSTGSVDAILTRASDALGEPYEDLLERVLAAGALNADETGWRTSGERRALWGLFTSRHAFFQVAHDRHEDHAKALLKGTHAVVTSDRWWAYRSLPIGRRQLCWSHLKRDFASHAEGLAAEKEFGEHGLELSQKVFQTWKAFQDTNDRRELKRTITQLQREYKPVIAGYAAKRARNKRCRGMARNLLKAWPALWSFAKHDGVQPTNNHAERALRSAVIYRKLSLGTQSRGGERRIERLLSAHTTCRLQHRSLHDYLTELLTAHARGDPIPLLT
jgi:transposase